MHKHLYSHVSKDSEQVSETNLNSLIFDIAKLPCAIAHVGDAKIKSEFLQQF
jgi:hypothetical protein